MRYLIALLPLFLFAAFVEPNDPLRSSQNYLDAIRAPAAWQTTTGPIRVALMDTGSPCLHPDLAGKCDPGFTATWAQQESPYDETWAGHAVTTGSILAAVTNNGIGIAGVAPDARLVPVKVCTKGGRCADQLGEDVDGVVAGLRWIIAQGDIKVVNASISSEPYFQAIQDVVCDARAAGITVVVAAGNNGTAFVRNAGGTFSAAPPLYPLASRDCMFVVGGMDPTSTRAPWVDVVAQNTSVYGAVCVVDYSRPLGVPCDASAYGARSGTSFSAPQVAGGAALIRSLARAWCNCAADVDFIEQTIKSTALPFACTAFAPQGGVDDPAPTSWVEVPSTGCGAGTPDLGAAVLASVPTPTPSSTPTATLTVTPTITPTPCHPPKAQRCR